MTDYKVEKLRRRLSLVLRDGRRLEGDVFLRPLSRFRTRPEEPGDLLNEADPFFALVTDGRAVLVAKANVSRVETAYAAEDDPDVASLGVLVEITLMDGDTCSGNIFLESRADRPRLLDYLNAFHGRFLPVVDATQVVFVNTQTIAHVREVA